MSFNRPRPHTIIFFFFNDTATTEIYTLSLHDALPISLFSPAKPMTRAAGMMARERVMSLRSQRSEEHTSELQSRLHLVCRLLLEKKKNQKHTHIDLQITGREPYACAVHSLAPTANQSL